MNEQFFNRKRNAVREFLTDLHKTADIRMSTIGDCFYLRDGEWLFAGTVETLYSALTRL